MIKVHLIYKNKSYWVIDELAISENGEIPFIWDEGNYACDCNRSLFIQRCCDKNFPDLPCGDSIIRKEFITC